MKTLSVILLLAVTMPGCSTFSEKARMDRAYKRQVKEIKAKKEARHKRMLEHQRAAAPSLRNGPPPLPMQTVQPEPDNQ